MADVVRTAFLPCIPFPHLPLLMFTRSVAAGPCKVRAFPQQQKRQQKVIVAVVGTGTGADDDDVSDDDNDDNDDENGEQLFNIGTAFISYFSSA